MRYGILHPDKEKKCQELVNYGEIKVSADIVDGDENYIRFRVIRYKDEVWFVHLQNGEVLEMATV